MPTALSRILVPLAALAAIVFAGWQYGWSGVALVVGGLMFWLLLHFTRLMTILKRAAARPVGFVGSAVMLNVKLKPGVTLLHVVALTRALGEQRSAAGEQPERFRWTDAGASYVDCEFRGGRLQRWTLVRPPAEAELAADAPAQPPDSEGSQPPAAGPLKVAD